MHILDELKIHKSFLSFFDEIELKLRNIFEGLHLILKMFERKHSQLVQDQLNRYSTKVDQILKQISDHLMLHEEDIESFPDVVGSHSLMISMRNTNYLSNINILIYSLNILASVDMKPKEPWADFIGKFFLKMFS